MMLGSGLQAWNQSHSRSHVPMQLAKAEFIARGANNGTSWRRAVCRSLQLAGIKLGQRNALRRRTPDWRELVRVSDRSSLKRWGKLR
jgi:hypothetical protein